MPNTYGGKTIEQWERVVKHWANGDPVKDLEVYEDQMMGAIEDFINAAKYGRR